jgi:hypothetical protein
MSFKALSEKIDFELVFLSVYFTLEIGKSYNKNHFRTAE